MLSINNLDVFYGDVQVLKNISLKINKGEIITLVGSNAAGKSTTINAISGINQCRRGRIEFNEQVISNLPPNKIVNMGLIQVPEGRKLFPEMTIRENLELGAYTPHARKYCKENLDVVCTMFPKMKDRLKQLAGSLSGGEQQMCAIARGLMAKPELLMFDEPSLGLSPVMVQNVFKIIEDIKKQGITVLLVEQNVKHSLKVSDRAYVLETGEIVMEGTGEELLNNEYLKKAYLGI